MASTEKLRYSNLAVERVLRMLKVFNSWQRELSYQEIAELADVPASTAYKLIQILVRHDFLEQRNPDGKYGIGREVFRLGDLHRASKNLVDIANSQLEELAEQLGLTASFAVRDGRRLAVLLSREGTSPISVASLNRHDRKEWLIHQSALGKALLLDMSDEELAEILPPPPWPASTPNSLCTLPELRKNLDQARSQGCTLDDEESTRGLRCVAFPIRDPEGEIVAAISVSATTLDITDQSLPDIMASVKEVGERISRKLGYRV